MSWLTKRTDQNKERQTASEIRRAGNKAMKLRRELAYTYLACEQIAQTMKEIRLSLPTRESLKSLEHKPVNQLPSPSTDTESS